MVWASNAVGACSESQKYVSLALLVAPLLAKGNFKKHLSQEPA